MPSHIPLKYPRYIGHRFALAQPDFFIAQQQTVPAQVGHRHRKADARAQAGFFKNHRKRLPRQQRIIFAGEFVLVFELVSGVQQMTKFGGSGLGE